MYLGLNGRTGSSAVGWYWTSTYDNGNARRLIVNYNGTTYCTNLHGSNGLSQKIQTKV